MKSQTETKPFGWHYSLDAHNCEYALISDIENVQIFFVFLAKNIGMTIYWGKDLKMMCEKYGNDKSNIGITGFCPILTSNFTIHTVFDTCSIYLDVFSCKYFETNKINECVELFFSPKGKVKSNFTVR